MLNTSIALGLKNSFSFVLNDACCGIREKVLSLIRQQIGYRWIKGREMKQTIKIKKGLSAALMTASLLCGSTAAIAGNINVEESVQLNAKPAAVWALVGDYNGLYRWHPAVAKSEREDKTRVLTLGNGAQITEMLLSKNEQQHNYTYSITESPLPVADYKSSISVQSDGQGGSKVIWSSSFNAAGASDSDAEGAIRGVYQAGLENLDKLYN